MEKRAGFWTNQNSPNLSDCHNPLSWSNAEFTMTQQHCFNSSSFRYRYKHLCSFTNQIVNQLQYLVGVVEKYHQFLRFCVPARLKRIEASDMNPHRFKVAERV